LFFFCSVREIRQMTLLFFSQNKTYYFFSTKERGMQHSFNSFFVIWKDREIAATLAEWCNDISVGFQEFFLSANVWLNSVISRVRVLAKSLVFSTDLFTSGENHSPELDFCVPLLFSVFPPFATLSPHLYSSFSENQWAWS